MKSLRLATAGLALAAISGCSPYSIFDPASGEAERLANLGWWLVGLMSVTIVIMGVLILWGALRRKGSLKEHSPIDVDGGKGWILFGGVLLPVVVLSALFAVTLVVLKQLPGDTAEPAVEIDVTAHQWWWGVTYPNEEPYKTFKTANEIHIPVGQPVRINLTSADVIHSFWVPRLHGKLDVIPGHENHLVLTAEKPGRYEGVCAEFCGVQHARMRFVVVAHPADEYQAWVEHQRKPARVPTEPLLVKGRETFETYACAMCHSIRGTRAHGSVAPDLTHFGSRLRIGGAVPNTKARLQAWIVNAQSLKAGVHMPTLDQFDGEQLRALAAYLESLE